MNDDCLVEIASKIDDFKAFYSFSLSCKRFYQASMHTKCWHVNIVSRKIRYYGTKFVINEFPKTSVNHRSNLPMIEDLLKIADTYVITKPTQENVMAIWDARGPVAAEMFKWIVDLKFRQMFSNNGELERIIKKMIIHLPCFGDMTVFTVFNLRPNEITLRLLYKETHFDYKITDKSNDFPTLNENHAKDIIAQARYFVNVLTEQVGDSEPSDLGELFVWLCFYPDSLKESFLGAFAETIPRTDFKATLLNVLRTQRTTWPYEDESLMRIIGESLNINIIRQIMMQLINKRQRAKILHGLNKEIYFVLEDINNLVRICPLSPDAILSLVTRITFLPSMSLGGFESEPEKTHFYFRTKGGGILQVEKVGLPLGKFRAIWNFTLPSGEYVHFEASDFERWRPANEGDVFAVLQPVTELLEDCINDDVDIYKHVTLTNHFTERLLSACLSYQHCDKVHFGL